MSWQGGSWRGGYWKGAKGRSPKGKQGQDKKPAQDKDGKANIPQYDAECWTGGSSASSSKPSEAQQGNLQDITKLLKTVVQAGKIELPPEALAILDATDKEDTRASYSAEQKALNAKRKVFNRVQRLRDAITKKTEKFKSFRLAIRDQLANETERFEKDMVDLKDNLQKAERDLERIESGEVEMEETTTENIDELDIFGAMDIVKEKEKLKQQLEQSEASNKEMEARYMAAQRQLQDQLQAMQQQMQAMTGHGALTAGGLHGATWPISPYYPIPRVAQRWFTAVACNPCITTVLKGEHIAVQGTYSISQGRQGGGCDEQVQYRSTEKFYGSHGRHGVELHCIQQVCGSGRDALCGSVRGHQEGQLPEEKNSPFECHAPGSGSSSLAVLSYSLEGRCLSMNVLDGHASFDIFDHGSEESLSDSSLVPENSNAERIVLACSGSPEDRILGSDYFEPVTVLHARVVDSVLRHWHEKNVRGCTLDACTQWYAAWYKIDWGCTHEFTVYSSARGRNVKGCTLKRQFRVPPHLHWAFAWLLQMQRCGYAYFLLVQIAFYVTSRLCFMHFKLGHQYTGEEFVWHIARGTFWFTATVTWLWMQERAHNRSVYRWYRNADFLCQYVQVPPSNIGVGYLRAWFSIVMLLHLHKYRADHFRKIHLDMCMTDAMATWRLERTSQDCLGTLTMLRLAMMMLIMVFPCFRGRGALFLPQDQ